MGPSHNVVRPRRRLMGSGRRHRTRAACARLMPPGREASHPARRAHAARICGGSDVTPQQALFCRQQAGATRRAFDSYRLLCAMLRYV